MRKFLSFALAATIVMVSCQKNGQPDKPVQPADNSISFGLSGILAEVQTRIYSENTATEVQANGFNVAGITGSTTMFNEKATFANLKYSPVNGPYYYPATGTMNFYAAYPVTQNVTVSGSTATLSYTQNPDTDLLAAKSTAVAASDNSVALAFDHILSLMKFKAIGADEKVIYKVKSVKINAPLSGDYTYSSNDWSNLSSTADYVYSSSVTQLSGTTDISGAVTIIPCIPTIKVEYDVYSKNGSTLIHSYSKTKALSAAVSQGKECTVTMTLPNDAAKEISFAITVNPWGSESQDITFEND